MSFQAFRAAPTVTIPLRRHRSRNSRQTTAHALSKGQHPVKSRQPLPPIERTSRDRRGEGATEDAEEAVRRLRFLRGRIALA